MSGTTDDRPTDAELAQDDDSPPGCRCRHDTSNPELGCECGWADWLCDEGLDQREAMRLVGRRRVNPY